MSIRIVKKLRYRAGDKYRAVLTHDYVIDLGTDYNSVVDFCNDSSKVIASLRGSVLHVRKGYASDLCSPACKIFGKWFGAPSGEREAEACVLHDCMRQLLHSDCCPWTRADADQAMHEVLVQKESPNADFYYCTVSGFMGQFFSKVKIPKRLICKIFKRLI